MKRTILYLAAILFMGCASAQNKPGDTDFSKLPALAPGEAVATFGGGCFWASSEVFSELKGVNISMAGFAGGTTKNPSYEDVCTESTGHAEVTQVYYDPKVISYEMLVKAYFAFHDPTTLNRQGDDEGTSYRSIAFYRTPEEKKILDDAIKEVNASKHYNSPVVTQVIPFKVFYPAEKYHQDYYKLHPDKPYIVYTSVPKVMKMRKAMKGYLKPEFAK